jgi:hypothetical protein
MSRRYGINESTHASRLSIEAGRDGKAGCYMTT